MSHMRHEIWPLEAQGWPCLRQAGRSGGGVASGPVTKSVSIAEILGGVLAKAAIRVNRGVDWDWENSLVKPVNEL